MSKRVILNCKWYEMSNETRSRTDKTNLVLSVFCVCIIRIMLRMIRLHFKMWVQVAVSTELHKKPIPLNRNWFFGVFC